MTHIAAAVFAFTGAIVLVLQAAAGADPWKLLGAAVYAVTLVTLYSVSSLYHSLHGRSKRILRTLDHLSIYLLIAGSYTPFCLVTLRGAWGWWLLGLVWGLAVIGGLQEMRPRRGARVLSVALYVLMGWLALAALVPLRDALGPAGFAWLVAGGLLYTFGIVFYALDGRVDHAHGIWHLFVIAGSIAHYYVIVQYVV